MRCVPNRRGRALFGVGGWNPPWRRDADTQSTRGAADASTPIETKSCKTSSRTATPNQYSGAYFACRARIARVTIRHHSDEPSLDPIQGVLEILDRASMTGTNKLGLLLALIEIAPEYMQDNQPISRRALAERYLNLHWEHGRPYRDRMLRQSSSKKKRKDDTVADDTTVMQNVHELRDLLRKESLGDIQHQSFEVVNHKMCSPEWRNDWEEALDKSLARIEKDLWRNPVIRLQVLPGKPDPFLFTLDNNQIQFLPNVAQQLTKYSGVLRPLIEFRFAQLVTKINGEHLSTPDFDIHEHLFGRDRMMPPDNIRVGLTKLQGGRCILTGRQIRQGNSSLDHVIPWSRTRLSAIENFLITTSSVNSSKSDSLLGPDLIDKWLNYLDSKSEQIVELADANNWPTDIERVSNIALHIYEVLDPAVGVWQGDDGVQPLGAHGKARITTVLLERLNREN